MTTLTDLIKSAERKVADPKTTPQTRERERDIAHYLTSMQAEIEIKESTLAGYRRENMMLHAEIKIKDDALTAMRAENTKLYADLCEIGDMARERSRKRTENVTISGNWDELLRHKWPEEKPENGDANKKYFLRIWYADGGKFVSEIVMDTWNGFTWEEYLEGYITHWWNLPEVTE